MVNTENSSEYQPLLVPSDRLTQRPITPWRAELARGLRDEIDKPEIDAPRTASVLNQLALLEAYQGHSGSALAVCDAQIRFWRSWAQAQGGPDCLHTVVQPWVNIVRLERWTKNLDNSMALYRELGPDYRSGFVGLQKSYGIEFTFDELDRLDPNRGVNKVLDAVYWREYANLLFSTANQEELLRHLKQGMAQNNAYLRIVMLEIFLAYRVNRGRYEEALSILRSLKITDAMIAWVPFKALEMYIAHRSGSTDFSSLVNIVVDGALSIRHGEQSARGLQQLVGIARLFERLGMHAEEMVLLQSASDMAQEMNDEVVSFEALYRLGALGRENVAEIRERFSTSRYAFIRKKLGLTEALADDGPDIVRALRALAELDFDGCDELLAHAPVCGMSVM